MRYAINRLERNEDESFEVASGACLAFVATWSLPAFEFAGDVVQAVMRTGGIQAQVMSAAELALCTRVEGLSAEDIKSALWQDHTLVKTWAMRATLHVLATSDLPLYVAALNFREFRNWSAYFAFYGLNPAQHEALLAAVPQVVGREPMTREQLAIALDEADGYCSLARCHPVLKLGYPIETICYSRRPLFRTKTGSERHVCQSQSVD